MSSRERKKMQKSKGSSFETSSSNSLIASCHDYASVSTLAPVTFPSPDADFPPLPITPSKSPAAKKALYETKMDTTQQDNVVICTLSKLINDRADALEKMAGENSKKIDENALKIEGLKKTVDFTCNEIKDAQKKLQGINSRLKEEEEKVVKLKERTDELEMYSKRWNLKLYGVAEDSDENVKEKVVKLCQKILPETSERPGAAFAVDVAHRLGKRTQNAPKPRAIMVRFSWRSYKEAIWRAAKNHPAVRNDKLRFAEDLSLQVKEARMKLWPAVQKARAEGKAAYYVGARAFINGQEMT